MTFEEYFAQVKQVLAGADVSGISDPTRIQVDIVGDAGGTFYVEVKGGKLAVEPYEYIDRDVKLTVRAEDFQKIMQKKLDPVLAFTLGKLKAEGDLGKALELKKLLR